MNRGDLSTESGTAKPLGFRMTALTPVPRLELKLTLQYTVLDITDTKSLIRKSRGCLVFSQIIPVSVDMR